MEILIRPGHCGLNARCRCDNSLKHQADDRTGYYNVNGHHCFGLGSPSLRGYCPPCFEAMFITPDEDRLESLRRAYHKEMKRINGFRIKNEKSFSKAMTSVVWDPKEGMWVGSRPVEIGGAVPRPFRKIDEELI